MSLPKGFDKDLKEMKPWQKTVFNIIIAFINQTLNFYGLVAKRALKLQKFLLVVELILLVIYLDTSDMGQKMLVFGIFGSSVFGALFVVPKLMSRVWKVKINFN